MKIPISKPLFGDEEAEAIIRPLRSGWVVQGPEVAEFEKRFADYTGAGHAIACTSATTALHASLVALEIGHGDEVVVPAFTWVASPNVVEMQHARPVFADIDLDTFNVNVPAMASAITAKTKVLMPVSLFGLSADIDPIVATANTKSLRVVEDDACATGAWYKSRHAGTAVDLGCFSFHPRKAITTGEGGMVITADDALAAKLRSLRDHGASKSDLARHHGPRSYILPDFDMVGFNYRMTDFQGAVGAVQMERLGAILEQRTRIAARYTDALSKLDWLRTPHIPPDYQHGWQSYVCLFAPEEPTLNNVEHLHEQRNALMDRLDQAEIATRPGTHAVHMLGYYRQKYGIRPEDFPNAYIADRLTLALPLYAQMSEEEQEYVISSLTRSFGN